MEEPTLSWCPGSTTSTARYFSPYGNSIAKAYSRPTRTVSTPSSTVRSFAKDKERKESVHCSSPQSTHEASWTSCPPTLRDGIVWPLEPASSSTRTSTWPSATSAKLLELFHRKDAPCHTTQPKSRLTSSTSPTFRWVSKSLFKFRNKKLSERHRALRDEGLLDSRLPVLDAQFILLN